MPRLLGSIAAVVVLVLVEKSGAILLARGTLMLHCIDQVGIDVDLHVGLIDHC